MVAEVVVSAEADGTRDGSSPDPPNTTNSELECVWQLTKGGGHERRVAGLAIKMNECLKPDPESAMMELDIVLDALSELSGKEGEDWVPVRRVQALTFLLLWRLGELFEDWESMGVIRRDDTRLWVAFCPSVADALNDEDCSR